VVVFVGEACAKAAKEVSISEDEMAAFAVACNGDDYESSTTS